MIRLIILIDEYDVPLDKAYQHGYYDQMSTTIRNIFNQALKSNESMQFAVMTDCLRIFGKDIYRFEAYEKLILDITDMDRLIYMMLPVKL